MPSEGWHWWVPSAEERKVCAWRALGVGIAIWSMELLADFGGVPIARVPFVTSIVLVMSYPDSEAARPRSIIAGHLLSSLAGLFVLGTGGKGEMQAAVAVALSALAMLVTRSPHPPAGLDAFLVVHNELGLAWVASPVAAGAIALALFGRVWAGLEVRVIRQGGSGTTL